MVSSATASSHFLLIGILVLIFEHFISLMKLGLSRSFLGALIQYYSLAGNLGEISLLVVKISSDKHSYC